MATTWNRFKGPGHEEEESRTSEEYKRGLEARITVHSATSNRRGGKVKSGKNKKNAFVMFMEEKRPEVEAAGHKLARGLADLAIILPDDWKKLAPEEKAVYEERSRKYNGEAAAQKKEENSSPANSKPKKKDIMLPGEFKEAYQLRMEREQWALEFEKKSKDNRDIVWDIFQTTNWSSKQIVVCSVSFFFVPLVEYVMFLAEPSVDDIVGTTDNYKYFEELCCMYHMKRRDGIKYCAMNTANRYVYCLLEILTRSNTVDNLRPGFHFPAISGRLNVESEERRIRLASLARWGFTQLELDMKDETYKMQRDVEEEEERCNRIQANMRRNPVENPRRTSAGQGRAPEPSRDLRRGRGFPDVDRVNQTPTEDLPEMLSKGLD